jgi:hypothetical protein
MAIPTGFGGRDFPDFGVSKTAGRDTNITDLSELAVRLGSLSWFDRMGTVLMVDGFERGIANWTANAYPAASFPSIASNYYAKVPYSAKLSTTTDPGSYSGMKRYFPFPYIANFGCEVHVKATTTFDTLYWWVQFFTGSYKYNVQVVLDMDEDELQVVNSLGGYDKIDNLDIKTGINSPFHVIKVTVDLDNAKYIRLLLDERDYNVSDIGISQSANVSSPYMYMLFYLKCELLTVNTVYIDNVVFTTNEPGV